LLTDSLFAARQLNIKNPKTSPKGASPRTNQQATSTETKNQQQKEIKSSTSSFSISNVLTPKVLRTSSISIYENLNRSLTGRGSAQTSGDSVEKVDEEKSKPEISPLSEAEAEAEAKNETQTSVQVQETGETDA
jgi:hypothetical protein